MALQAYLFAKYLHTAENKQFRQLCKLLSARDEDYYLIANPIIGGRESDALLIKRDAIIVIEFKNYSGQLTALQFGDWEIETEKEHVIVKGGYGGKNPFQQVHQNRWGVINAFNEFGGELINAYHTSGLVLFNGDITEKQYDFPESVKRWFYITDMNHVLEDIDDIVAHDIEFSDSLWDKIPEFLHIDNYLWDDFKQDQTAQTELIIGDNFTQERNLHDDLVGDCPDECKQNPYSIKDETLVESIIRAEGFKICHKHKEEAKPEHLLPYDDIGLSQKSISFLRNNNIKETWSHQVIAIKNYLDGKNICITTSTSSGKSEIFQICAIEALERNPNAKVLAVYPMKALNRQQKKRWEASGYEVGKIDGDIASLDDRKRILNESRIVVMTPDVIHAFLLAKINDSKIGPTIQNFIKHIELIIIDELHLYRGVFGTNSAYLFRRLNNIRRLLRNDHRFAQYITATATLPNAIQHSANITGAQEFLEIGADEDGSPSAERVFYYLDEAPDSHTHGKELITNLVYALRDIDDAKSITFVEGRQRTGQMADTDEDSAFSDSIKAKSKSYIYPFRSGYEQQSVDIITQKIEKGDFKGIISTSALEIGINIKGLNIAIIADMPHDKNSYMQRIGRVGRKGCDKCYVIIIKTNTLASALLFNKYNYNIERVLPDYEPALYLEENSVQYVHAYCHVGSHDFCEYQKWLGDMNNQTQFDGEGYFPASFIKLCNDMIQNQIENKNKEIENSQSPQLDFPLRSIGAQFAICPANDRVKIPEGEHITRNQLSSEGYKGCIRNTLFNGEKIYQQVIWVDKVQKKVLVKDIRNEANYTTTPNRRIYLKPNFTKKQRNRTIICGNSRIFNLSVDEYVVITGFAKKLYGNIIESEKYEKRFELPKLETTGTLIFHPSFNGQDVNITIAAKIVFESFLRLNAFDRNDISCMGGRLTITNDVLRQGDKFVALYDLNKLNISSRLASEEMLRELMSYYIDNKSEIVHSICDFPIDSTLMALDKLCDDILQQKISTEYADLGVKRAIDYDSEILYRDENEEFKAFYDGDGRSPFTCNIYLSTGEKRREVPLENIIPTKNTRYVEITIENDN